jgi:NitT/TauT family transport system ATP-binding protein
VTIPDLASPASPSPGPDVRDSGAIAVQITGLEKSYPTEGGESITALAPLDLTIRKGSFVSILGPSGCGKSTLLRIVGGLESYRTGSVVLDGSPVTGPRRDTGIVFQQPVLLPWRSILDNVLLPVDVARGRNKGTVQRARDLIDLVGLGGFEKRYPRELSGGMQQRAGLVRALITEPSFLLMDEPFGALDAMTRETMNVELLRIWEETSATVLFVTHSITESVFLSDSVVVLSGRPGRVLDEIPVDLPRPRTWDLLDSPEFGRLTNRARSLLSARGGVE